jgi:hypothetical protein
MIFNKILAVTCLLAACSFSASAQFGYARYANSEKAAAKLEYIKRTRQQSTLGMSFRFASADFKLHYKENANGAPSLYKSLDTSFERRVTTNLDYSTGLFYDWFIPIASIDDKSIMAITLNGCIDFFKFQITEANTNNSSFGQMAVSDVSGDQVGLMVGLEYKSGGDAVLNKRYKGMFSLGAGVMPSIFEVNYGALGNEGYFSKFKMTPYIRSEIGFLFGIAFKLKADILFGQGTYFNASNVVNNNKLDVSLKSTAPTLRLSVGIMPFSWDWDRDY